MTAYEMRISDCSSDVCSSYLHSLLSCWNHGNAHFQRGLLRELKALGHQASAMEPVNSWSLSNLMADHGEAVLSAFRNAYPELSTSSYDPARFDADRKSTRLNSSH